MTITNVHCQVCGRPFDARLPLETPVLCEECQREYQKKLEGVDCEKGER